MAKQTKADADFLRLARDRFQAGIDADRENRRRDEEDRRFYKGEQWTLTEKKERNGRITMTVNRLPQFVKQVTGEMRQNKPAIRVLPKEEGHEGIAEVYGAIIRHIESISDAHRIYNKAGEQAVIGGIGWFRILTDYLDNSSFDQEIMVKPIRNPLSVVHDPDARELTRQDMNWAFVTELVSRKKFEKEYPGVSLAGFDSPNDEYTGWHNGDFIRVAEYWYREPVTKTLAQFSDGSVDYLDGLDLEAINADRVAQQLPPITVTNKRSVDSYKVRWCRMTGVAVIDEGEWEGCYIPLVPVIGEEVEAGDEIYRHGLVHHTRDAQKSYNYARSAMVEHIGNQPKAPWLVTADMIKNYKSMWENANRGNPAALVYDVDTRAPGLMPKREEPPTMPTAWYQEAQISDNDMKATTGIYDASLGNKSNETSGRAIIARDSQGETATYVYVDNLSAAIRYAGIILIDLIPHIYSGERIIRIVGEDGSIEDYAKVNTRLPDGSTFNDLSQGSYDVEVTTGPAYATKRQQAADWMMQFIQAYPPAAQLAGDLIAKSLDLPQSEKLGERLSFALPPGMDEDADKMKLQAQIRSMQMQQMLSQIVPPDPMQQVQVAGAQANVAKVQAQAQEHGARAQKAMVEAQTAMMPQPGSMPYDRALQLAIEAYNAETGRLKVAFPQGAVPPQIGDQAAQKAEGQPIFNPASLGG